MTVTNETVKVFKRIVTGHDSEGRAVVLSDAPPTRVQRIGGAVGPTFFEVWNTHEMPVMIDRQSGESEERGVGFGASERRHQNPRDRLSARRRSDLRADGNGSR